MSDEPFAPFDDLAEEAASSGATDLEVLVRRALDLVQEARAMPLSSSVLVQRDELCGLLEDALERIPEEMRQARWLLRERDEFLEGQRREADQLLEEVKAQAERMVQRTEIVRQAHQAAQRIVDDAREEARKLQHQADDYCDQKLASFEIVLDRTLRTVQAGREKLQFTASPVGEEEWPAADAEEGGAGASTGGDGDGGFFDQDLS